LSANKRRAGVFWIGCCGPIILCLGVPGVLLGSLVISTQDYSQLSCKKIRENQNICQLTSSSLLKAETKSFQLYGADVEASSRTSRKNQIGGYRTSLLTSKGKIPLTDIYTSYSARKEEVSKVLLFVESSGEKSLRITTNYRLLTFFICTIYFLFVGPVILICGTFIYYSLIDIFQLEKS
jgi:hypothetical protein